MQSPARAYSSGLAGAVAARGLSVVAGVLSLWLLSRILDTEDFAGYAAAMSYAILLGHLGGLGLERSMLLRISPVAEVTDRLAGRRLVLRVALAVAVLSLAVSALTLAILGAVPLLQEGRTDDWIRLLWPVIPLQALLIVLVHWYQANHWHALSQLSPGVNDAARCAAFLLVYALGLGALAVAAGAAVAALLSIVLLVTVAFGRTEAEPAELRGSDFAAGLQFLVMRFSNMGLRQIDLIVMGFLVGGLGTAAYAVASRIADLALLGQHAFGQTYAPRVGRHRSHDNGVAISREYNATRALSFLATVSVALVLVLLGERALGIFGDFARGYPALLVITAGHLLTASFGVHDMHMSMTGHLGRATINRVLGLVAFVAMLALLVPRFGGIGAAMSFFAASVVYSLGGAAFLFSEGQGRMLHPSGIAAGFVSAAGLIYAALAPAPPAVAATTLVVAAAMVIIWEASLLRRALGFGSGD